MKCGSEFIAEGEMVPVKGGRAGERHNIALLNANDFSLLCSINEEEWSNAEMLLLRFTISRNEANKQVRNMY